MEEIEKRRRGEREEEYIALSDTNQASSSRRHWEH
jgi:hypothetical protein